MHVIESKCTVTASQLGTDVELAMDATLCIRSVKLL